MIYLLANYVVTGKNVVQIPRKQAKIDVYAVMAAMFSIVCALSIDI